MNSSMRIGWLDFSNGEREKINAFLKLLEEKENLDELGLAPIRDGFANLFFPGLSTLVWRAKYFLIVPYALRDLEKIPGPNLARQLRDIERDCGRQLVKGDDNARVIGKNSLKNNAWVAQAPSAMYWSPLRNFGIFRQEDMSLSSLLRMLESGIPPASAPAGRLEADEGAMDDYGAGGAGPRRLWHPALPYKADWRDNLRISLSRKEAVFLKERILEKTANTLLGHILENNLTQIEQCGNFLDLEKIIDLFPNQMRDDYRLARDFSLFAEALRAAFALMISRDQHVAALNWFAQYKDSLAARAKVDIKAIYARLAPVDRNGLEPFLEQAREAMLREDDLKDLKTIVASRERAIKAMPKSGKAEPVLEWSGLYANNYRYGNCRNICKDIFAGLGLKAAANA